MTYLIFNLIVSIIGSDYVSDARTNHSNSMCPASSYVTARNNCCKPICPAGALKMCCSDGVRCAENTLRYLYSFHAPLLWYFLRSGYETESRNWNIMFGGLGLGLGLELIILGTLSLYYYAHSITPC